jgi:hypothetical protein
MMREQWYLCRVPWMNTIVVFTEQDYNYQRKHEQGLFVPDPENDVVLLAQGSFKEMMLLKGCFKGELTNVS